MRNEEARALLKTIVSHAFKLQREELEAIADAVQARQELTALQEELAEVERRIQELSRQKAKDDANQ